MKKDGTVEAWIDESHQLAKSFAYAPEIIDAVGTNGELQPINLPESYLEEAGRRGRQRVVVAGLRAGTLLIKTSPTLPSDQP